MAMMSREISNAAPIMRPKRYAADLLFGGAGECRSELSGCCDERAGLLVHDSEVMLDRVDMRGGAPGRAHLPGDQLGERLGDDREGLGVQPRG